MTLNKTEMCEEAPEAKRMRKKDEEISKLKDVIVEQAKALTDSKQMYLELTDCNAGLRDTIDRLYREQNSTFDKIVEIKDLLDLAKQCANDKTKTQKQRAVSKIRVECLQDVIDILEGNKEATRYKQ